MPLTDLFSQHVPRVADGVADIQDAEAQKDKQRKYLLLLVLLSDWRTDTNSALNDAVGRAVTESQRRFLKLLPAEFRDRAPVTEQQFQSFAGSAIQRAMRDFGDVLNYLQGLGAQLRAGKDGLLRKLLGRKAGESLTDSGAREILRKKVINVRGSDGIDRNYAPETYSDLLESGAVDASKAETAKAMAQNIDSDLVLMSPPTGRDFCDIFAGMPYSISGTNPKVYPLSIIPNGNCPMHCRCVHTLTPIPADKYSDDELRSMSQLPREFVELGMSGKSTADSAQRLFLQKSPEEWGL